VISDDEDWATAKKARGERGTASDSVVVVSTPHADTEDVKKATRAIEEVILNRNDDERVAEPPTSFANSQASYRRCPSTIQYCIFFGDVENANGEGVP
jgi:hypothetical protein